MSTPLEAVLVERTSGVNCVSTDALVAGIRNAGPFLPSVTPKVEEPARSPVPLLRIRRASGGLVLQAWGLQSDPLYRWFGDPAPTPLEQPVETSSCETTTEAIVAAAVSLLSATQANLLEAEHSALRELLEDARAQLGGPAPMDVGVRYSASGLDLVVEGRDGRCRRGTWLKLGREGVELGRGIRKLSEDVSACLEMERSVAQMQHEQRSVEGRRARAASSFHLPTVTGALIAIGGPLATSRLSEEGRSGTFAAYVAAPALIGGLSGYLVESRTREALWLSGYWLSAAGGALVSSLDQGGTRATMIGTALTAGALGSSALSLGGALVGAEDAPNAWAVATPAAMGALLAAGTLAIDGGGPRPARQLAMLGAAFVAAPALWLPFAKALDAQTSDAPQIGMTSLDGAMLVSVRGAM